MSVLLVKRDARKEDQAQENLLVCLFFQQPKRVLLRWGAGLGLTGLYHISYAVWGYIGQGGGILLRYLPILGWMAELYLDLSIYPSPRDLSVAGHVVRRSCGCPLAPCQTARTAMVSCQPQRPIRKVFSCCSGDSLALNAVERQSCAIILSRAGEQLVHTPANNHKYMGPKIRTCTSDTLTVTIQASPNSVQTLGADHGVCFFILEAGKSKLICTCFDFFASFVSSLWSSALWKLEDPRCVDYRRRRPHLFSPART